MKKKHFLILNMIIPCMVMFLNVNAQSSVEDKESARVFVQKFYTWSFALFKADVPGEKNQLSDQEIIMKHSKEFFGQNLRKALENYYNKPTKDGDIGLDFDPFMAGQDFGEGYQTGNVKQEGNKFLIDVHDIKNGQSRKAVLAAALLVTVEVTKEAGKWTIANFIYPADAGNTTLLQLLKNQQKGK